MATSFKRMWHRDAKRLLDEYCRAADGKPASTNKAVGQSPNPDGGKRAWWLENLGACPPHDSPRSKAYLAAYVEIGGPIFFGTGIPLQDGFMHPDRGVMKAMLLAGCVILDEDDHGRFKLTEAGRDIVRDVPRPPANQDD